jgi:replicative superfamily II helicase
MIPILIFKLENLIYTAPTSAGKTLVSEVLMVRNLLRFPNKKALFIMPYVSLISEKESKLEKLLKPLQFKLASIYSHKSNLYMILMNILGCIINEEISVVICTIEKANTLVNRLIETNEI